MVVAMFIHLYIYIYIDNQFSKYVRLWKVSDVWVLKKRRDTMFERNLIIAQCLKYETKTTYFKVYRQSEVTMRVCWRRPHAFIYNVTSSWSGSGVISTSNRDWTSFNTSLSWGELMNEMAKPLVPNRPARATYRKFIHPHFSTKYCVYIYINIYN